MPQQVMTSVENNFTRGLITESTGLNFPENAATSASNCEFTLIGDVTRRLGIDQEANGIVLPVTAANMGAMSSYVWNTPGGDGDSKLLVRQYGNTLYFYNVAASTVTVPLSQNILGQNISLIGSVPVGGTFDITQECQFADGNGYLFVYHPSCDPTYVTYNPITQAVTPGIITVQIRDQIGVIDNLPVAFRPTTLSTDHQYNLANQGWTTSPPWAASSSTLQNIALGSLSWNIGTVAGISNGQNVLFGGINTFSGFGDASTNGSGTVTGYSGGILTLNVTSFTVGNPFITNFNSWTFSPVSTGYVSTWFTSQGNYPSNSDIWWLFKDSTGVFNPTTTQPNVGISFGQAPQGHYVLSAFNMDRSTASGILGINKVTTMTRPSTGTWFQGRVWYTGLNDAALATSDTNYYTWTENIYFSSIVSSPTDFGLCYENNDPTAEDLNELLPTDGGVINVVGSGKIFKLFPIANGMLIFAANGVWYLTGSQGIGFSANDYTITKISSVKCFSNTSFVDVVGLPYFWNQEGIYQVVASQNGSLAVEPITVGTILSFYNAIPLSSRKTARGDYDPVGYVIQWSYRNTPESSVFDRYNFDTILNYNVYNKSFFPFNISSVSNGNFITDVRYISYPLINSNTPEPGFKYPYEYASPGPNTFSQGFAEELDTNYVDWESAGGADYTSFFTIGYKLHGQGLKKFQVPYVYVYSRNEGYAAYYIQGIWDFAVTTKTSKQTNKQFVELNDSNTSMIYRRHKIRGRGTALQLSFSSVSGQPFDIMGWAVYDNINTGA